MIILRTRLDGAALVALMSLVLATVSCQVIAQNEEFFGKTTPPARNILRYINGDEPESLDPPISSGQPEARIFIAIYEGLVEYDPKTLEPVPAIAERWDVNNDSSEYVFHLRHDARWSNGDPIGADDFVYSFRRSLSPQLASRNAYLAYYIKYGQAYNEGAVFVRDLQTGQFLLERDFANSDQNIPESLSQKSLADGQPEYKSSQPAQETAFHKFMHSPARLTLAGSEKARNKLLEGNTKLQTAVTGEQFVPVSGEDIGIEAVDPYTVRLSLSQPAPYFSGLLAHQLFRVVPRKVIEKYGEHL